MSEQSERLSSPMSAPASAAMEYVKYGWEPIRLPPLKKTPTGKWKEARSWTDAEINAAFSESSNIGIALGKRSANLIDIDFDCREAAELAKIIVSDFPSFGRAGSPNSHRVIHAKLKKGRYTFDLPSAVATKLGAERTMLLEIRGSGHQTMFPPSTHPSGEKVHWHDDSLSVPQVEAAELLQQCGLIAALSAVTMAYPKGAGERDEVCLILTGVLVRAGLDDQEIDLLVPTVAALAGDDEAEKRGGKAAASRQKIEAGENTWGLPELCKRLGLEDLEPRLRDWLRLGGLSAEVDGLPSIVVRAGHMPGEVDQAEAALLSKGFGIYQRGEDLVRVVKLPHSTGEDGVRRAGGIILIKKIEQPWLLEKFSLAARWFRPGEEANIPIDPPPRHATQLLARIGDWRASVLHGVVSTPTMRRDGTVLQTPGFDPASGLLYEPNGVQFPEVPEMPSRADAISARDRLMRPFRDFKFQDEADRSVVLTTVITSLIRRNLPSAPMIAIDAPTAGSGKSLLAETIGVIATGHKPTMISQGKSPEEDEKRLSSVLMAGDPVLVIDNCDRPLGGDTLCSMLTQEFIAARILGRSEVIRMPTNVLIMATGNNLEVVGDLGRRTLVIRIDTGEERPDQIEHSFDPRVEAADERPAIVVAGLTILRAYIAAGRPTPLTPMGSFEEWNLVREALVWLDEKDPIVTRERVIADDPRKGELADLLATWGDALGGRAVTLAEIADEASHPSGNVGRLHQILAERTPKGIFSATSIGRYLGRHKDRLVGGRVLRCIDDPSGVKRYRLEVPGAPPADDTPF